MRAAAAAGAVALGVLAMMLGGTAAFGAASGTAFAPCLAVGSGDEAHFLVDHSSQGVPAISGVVLSNLDPATCDGQPVVVTFAGNVAGDPQLPADEPLAVLDSTKDPCSGQTLANPVLVSAGSITLHGCSTVLSPKDARYVNVHAVTVMSVQVNGQTIDSGLPTSVLGETFTNNGGNSNPALGTRVGGTHEVSGVNLPFTGTWAALTFWLGLLLLLVGAFVLYLGERRRRTALEPPTP